MNQVFEFKRWWLLTGRHWSENKKKYILSLAALASLFFIWFMFIILMDPSDPINEGLQATSYFFGLFIAGCLFASLLFAELASKSKGISYLSVPASQLEKLLCSLFYGVLIFFASYTLVFYLMDIPFVKIANALAAAHWLEKHQTGLSLVQAPLLNIFGNADKSSSGYSGILLSYLPIQAAFLLGSIYFPKFSFIKTIIALLLTSFIFSFFMGKIFPSILPKGSFYHGITSYRFFDGLKDQVISLPQWTEDGLNFIVKYAFAPILWVVTFFRLKEKEI